jgi:hypothetical protein
MDHGLTALEQRTVRDLLTWDRTRRTADHFVCMAALVLGGLVVIAVAVYTLGHLQDREVLWVTLPGFLSGILLFLFYLAGEARLKDRHRFATIIRKLTGDGERRGNLEGS